MIIDHNDIRYQRRWSLLPDADRWNGAYYYSQEIVQNIIPSVKTDRSWITVNCGVGANHSILFVHDNLYFERTYEFMRKYDDVIYVVSLPDMVERAEKFGKTIFLPMSIDTAYVKTFKRKKDRTTAYAGRIEWFNDIERREGVDVITDRQRFDFLQELAHYKNVYAVCRVAIEARALGCRVLPFHPRFKDMKLWNVLDNVDAARMLQKELDKIDG